MTTPTKAVIALGYLNRGLTATWSASSELPTLPAANLGTNVRTEPWQSDGEVEDQWIKAHLASPLPVRLPALIESNLTAAATVRIQANATDSWGSPTLDEPFDVWDQTRTYVLLALLADAHSLSWWRWTIDDPTNPDGFLRVGVGFLSPAVAFTRGPAEFTVTRIDPSPSGRSAGQTPRAWSQPKSWLVEWTQRRLASALLYGDLFSAYEALGTSEDGVLSVFSASPSETAFARGTNIYGRFERMPQAVYDNMPPDFFVSSASFLESR